ncbi:conjugative transfer signal peptidase TraF [Acidithiobacillus ferrivorans]|nr:conjugative transfer signal peptidase TraF [Acidithiobacillus ferrivorans]
MSFPQNTQKWIGVSLTGLAAGSVLALQMGFPLRELDAFYNDTPSEPMGFYQSESLTHPLMDGEIVTFCPDPQWPLIRLAKQRGWLVPGFCPGNMAPFLKTVIATPGETVTLGKNGMCVNDRCLPHSAPKSRSWAGQSTLPHYPWGTYTVRPETVWLYGSLSAWSMDSRYYGPVSGARLRQKAVPVLTWK